jgi:hypothetical protein
MLPTLPRVVALAPPMDQCPDDAGCDHAESDLAQAHSGETELHLFPLFAPPLAVGSMPV